MAKTANSLFQTADHKPCPWHCQYNTKGYKTNTGHTTLTKLLFKHNNRILRDTSFFVFLVLSVKNLQNTTPKLSGCTAGATLTAESNHFMYRIATVPVVSCDMQHNLTDNKTLNWCHWQFSGQESRQQNHAGQWAERTSESIFCPSRS